jgi:hypothetical protein
MFIRIFGLFALAFALCGTQCWADSSAVCTPGDGFIACQFVQGTTNVTGTFDFGTDGVITFQFDTILISFELDVSAHEVTSITNLDTAEFPTGTVCIPYTTGFCVRYDVSGNAGGPNHVPVRGVNYNGLISLTLNYDSFYTPHIPAFGHAPGDNATDIFSEDILTSYVDEHAPPCTGGEGCGIGPAMGGKTPGISSFAALDKPFAQPPGDTVCPFLTAVPQTSSSGQNPIVEVSFKLVASNCNTDPPLRDKTATLSVASVDPNNPPNLAFAPLINGGDSNKFHYDSKNGVNVQDINTNKLSSGKYFVTVSSTLFSPVTTTFIIP